MNLPKNPAPEKSEDSFRPVQPIVMISAIIAVSITVFTGFYYLVGALASGS